MLLDQHVLQGYCHSLNGAKPEVAIMFQSAQCLEIHHVGAIWVRSGKHHGSACSGASQRSGDLLLVPLNNPSLFNWLSSRPTRPLPSMKG